MNQCAQGSCSCPGSLGLGWGLSTQLVEWYCPEHFRIALSRLARLLEHPERTINSLLLAFSAVSVWEAFSSADGAVTQEANTVSALARDLAVYDSAESRHARQMLPVGVTEELVAA